MGVEKLAKTSYRVTIERIDRYTKPNGEGYTNKRDVVITAYQQTVSDLNIAAVALAVNQEPVVSVATVGPPPLEGAIEPPDADSSYEECPKHGRGVEFRGGNCSRCGIEAANRRRSADTRKALVHYAGRQLHSNVNREDYVRLLEDFVHDLVYHRPFPRAADADTKPQPEGKHE